ncbi:hypothetical protein HanXRQr2_Chr13g0615281 [Helianthus annuus]|uniref:Uncharacterized protein n=1 Tax=Helianthus annuus TaxID=4232 RepID=A0A9K3HE30_HELAN|nr:hypothetical protein HanXRQr2_Chr13g0615281 [Helianthus annuus]
MCIRVDLPPRKRMVFNSGHRIHFRRNRNGAGEGYCLFREKVVQHLQIQFGFTSPPALSFQLRFLIQCKRAIS